MKKNTIDIGVKLGTLLFIITALVYVIDVKLFTNPYLMLAFMLPTLVFSIFSVISARKIQNQVISFKEAFIAYFLCVAIGYFIATIGNIVLFKIIDPSAADLIHEEIMLFSKTMMENFNTPSDIINETMNEMQNNHSFLTKLFFKIIKCTFKECNFWSYCGRNFKNPNCHANIVLPLLNERESLIELTDSIVNVRSHDFS